MTAEERAQFDSWRRQSFAHERTFQEISALWNDPDLFQAATEVQQTIPLLAPSPPPHRPGRRMLAATAAILMVMTVMLYQLDLRLVIQSDYVTAAGEHHTLTLADQSTVILNSRSAVAAAYGPEVRLVRLLKGEALFHVQPDKTRPFLVEQQGVVTRAVGTSFIVRERREGVQITVIEGIVSVQPGHPNSSSISLASGQQAIVYLDGASSIRSIDTEVASAWVQGRLVFDTMPFSEVLEEVARYHPGYVGLWNPALAELRVSGSYNLANTSLILASLAQTLPVHMTSLTDRFVVFR
jgi:transmembrane sensor